jgi:hypothetical protein
LKKPIKGHHFQLHKYLSDLGFGTILPKLNEENWEFVVAYAPYMTSHDYMTIDPNIHILFIINRKNDIVINVICDYVLFDCSHIYHNYGIPL